MGYTSFDEIYTLFLNSIQDYTIRKLFESDVDSAIELMEYYIIRAIPNFRGCKKDIKNPVLNEKRFNCELDIEEKVILSDLMVLSWMDRVINDIVQMNLSLNDNDWRLCAVA